MKRRVTFAIIKLAFAAATLLGLVLEFGLAITRHEGIVNFFSYFTTVGNLLAIVMLAISAIWLIRNKKPSVVIDGLRGMALLNMLIVGIVYVVLLRNTASDIAWVNVLHHYIMPVVMIVDWLLQPPASKVAIGTVFLWFLLPIVYLAYTLIRGIFTNFYPYDFLNPKTGYGGVFIYCGVMLVAFLGLGFAVRAVGNWLATKKQLLS